MTTELDTAPPPPDVPGARPRKRWRRIPILVACLILLISAAWMGARAMSAVMTGKPKVARVVGNPIRVAADAVTREEIREVVGGTTLALGFVTIAVAAAVSDGRIKSVKGDLGQVVKAGDVLAEFDTDVFRETLERSRLELGMAKAELHKVKTERDSRVRELASAISAAQERVASGEVAVDASAKTLGRIQALLEQKVATLAELEQARVKWEEAKASVARGRDELVKAENDLRNEPAAAQSAIAAADFKLGVAEQNLAQARRNIANTVVRAPNAGVIVQRNTAAGEWVKGGGQPLFVLDRIEPIYAVAEIEQEKAAYVSVGQAASVVFDSYPSEMRQGLIAKIDPSIDRDKRTFKAFVQLANPASKLRPGMAAFTRIEHRREMTLVPRLAVINPTGAPSVQATVFVVVGDTVEIRKVRLGRPEGLGKVEVLAGLEPGEWVVVHGQKDINPGDRVVVERRVTREAAAPGTAPGKVR